MNACQCRQAPARPQSWRSAARTRSLRSEGEDAQAFLPRWANGSPAMAPSGHPCNAWSKAAPPGTSRRRIQPTASWPCLEALTPREVRTPLATIRTLIAPCCAAPTCLPWCANRLEQIDSEMQVNRSTASAESSMPPNCKAPPPPSQFPWREPIWPTLLAKVLLRLWERQLGRRGLVLKLEIEDQFPPVMSDPNLLETMLGGLIDRFNAAACRPAPRVDSVCNRPLSLKLQPSTASSTPQGRKRRLRPPWRPSVRC